MSVLSVHVSWSALAEALHDIYLYRMSMVQPRSQRSGVEFTPMTRDKKPANQASQWPPRSYSSLAELLGNNDGLAIYRRFATLNAQNLLYLQSELINLEDELKRPVIADSLSDDEQRRVFKHDVTALKNAPSDAAEGKQWKKVLEIREKLKEYSM